MSETARRVEITTEYIRLDQLMKLSGLCTTGGEAKEEIGLGRVTVNGEVCLLRGKKLRSADRVGYGGTLVEVFSK
jgi:ribosome-associated protein